jgi:transcriptional regulator with XRE-family HTH domain
LSTKADTKRSGGDRQRVTAAEFGERIRAAMARKSLTNSDVARVSGISRQLVSEYAGGQKVAGADNLFSIADALEVYPRWLIRGEGEMAPSPQPQEAADLVALPRFNVHTFGEYGKGQPVETVRVPAAWLAASVKSSTGLWLTEMPSDALPDVAREGETIICRDPETPLQDRRVYIFLLDGRPIVRRISFQPHAIILRAEDEADTITLRPDEMADRLMPAGRILATVRLDQV